MPSSLVFVCSDRKDRTRGARNRVSDSSSSWKPPRQAKSKKERNDAQSLSAPRNRRRAYITKHLSSSSTEVTATIRLLIIESGIRLRTLCALPIWLFWRISQSVAQNDVTCCRVLWKRKDTRKVRPFELVTPLLGSPWTRVKINQFQTRNSLGSFLIPHSLFPLGGGVVA